MTEEQFQALIDLIQTIVRDEVRPSSEAIWRRHFNAVRVRAHDLLVTKP